MKTDLLDLADFARPAVRDLAFLLASPSPWRCGADIEPARLLGPNGVDLLRRLDDNPLELETWLAARPATRLGKYAEQLFSFWFRLTPHIEWVAENLKVISRERRTLGEFDFLLRLDGEALHLETASKFYLQLDESPASRVGPSLHDAWAMKATKITTQLALARQPDGKTTLPAGFADCASMARLTGWTFHPSDTPRLARQGPTGWHAPLDTAWPQNQPEARWAWLPKLRWLSPALLPAQQTQDQATLRRMLAEQAAPQLVAELRERADGQWEEVARGFITPPGWPDPSRLAALQARIDAALA
ncbi:DUF1853 family protein [Chromobacterium sp. IIBBL 290-4]|uniref:DUF1853 family protein n=1 Tax=Chromobacterium sp. IIBBL 290-4 TaxID=2953890 RepID=UPI0020B8F958|nr:DUF1853 family protein [Chromobacterium sp. IIBBL 290-4]UTH72449.1 DUF1853 family protein [Chromobacterium sp. IIBBL 290-4]